MTAHMVDRRSTHLFSSISNDLVYEQEKLKPLIQQPFSLEAFGKQIQLKGQSYSPQQREVLVQTLHQQYSKWNVNDRSNLIARLANSNTFAVTTGHQLSLYTGPLFFIYKIWHVIQLAEKLKNKYPSCDFVPVFWMASEDHDLEEIQSIQLFNQKFSWQTDQTGAVGRMNAQSLSEVHRELTPLFEKASADEVTELLEHYQGKTVAEATFRLVNHLFKDQPLVILDADEEALKKSLLPVLKAELNEQLAAKKVAECNQTLEKMGYEPQAHARPVNFFYLQNQSRERIVSEDGIWKAGDKVLGTTSETLQLFENDPVSFSPNVILRPVYQEIILPNLCYVGGGGEMAYWLQLKGIFESHQIPFPIIQVRNSVVILDKSVLKKMEQLQWTVADLFKDLDQLKKDFVLENTALDFSHLSQQLEKWSDQLRQEIEKVDQQLKAWGEAEITRFQKSWENIQAKLVRTEKQKHQHLMDAMDFIHNRLFDSGIQERTMNLLQLCGTGEVQSVLQILGNAIDPLQKDLIVLEWEK